MALADGGTPGVDLTPSVRATGGGLARVEVVVLPHRRAMSRDPEAQDKELGEQRRHVAYSLPNA